MQGADSDKAKQFEDQKVVEVSHCLDHEADSTLRVDLIEATPDRDRVRKREQEISVPSASAAPTQGFQCLDLVSAGVHCGKSDCALVRV